MLRTRSEMRGCKAPALFIFAISLRSLCGPLRLCGEYRAGPEEGYDYLEEYGSMENMKAWRLAKLPPPLTPTDTAATAMEAFALQGVRALPVVEGSSALGYVTQSDLVLLAGGLREWCASDGKAGKSTCRRAIRPFGGAVNAEAGFLEMARTFDRTSALLLPVVTGDGRIVGYITPDDLLSPAEKKVVLPSTGGMATPFGVYLTADGVSGGVGMWALVVTGALMGIGAVISEGLSGWMVQAASQWSASYARLHSWPMSSPGFIQVIAQLLELLLFLILIRLTPLAGFHAAEHQTVHTLEAQEPLTPDRVRRKPRVHPRCGTNLMIVASMAGCLGSYVAPLIGSNPELGQTLLPVGIIFIFLFRLSIGGFVQQYFTTRPATDAQIESGIWAAQDLMTNYAQSGMQSRPLWRRLWTMGILQVALGMCSVLLLVDGLQRVVEHVKW